MAQEFKNPKYIIVLGTTFSGSGAIFDYLNGRGDLYTPISEEYLLPILPNGLMSLEAISNKAFDPAITENAILNFKDTAYKLMNYWTSKIDKNDINKKLSLYKNAINEFIDEISSADYPMRLFWRELNKSKVEIFIDKINKFLGFKKNVKTRLIVSDNELVLAAQKMHDKMFLPDSNGLPILLDQGGSGWNPVESTKYYSNCKTVIVTRDPRDQFAEIKAYKEGGSVNGFIDWYNEMQRRHKFIKNDNILFIKFEDFIKDNKNLTKILCQHMSISSSVSSKYQLDISKKNVGKFHQYLDKNEIFTIESKLSDYIRF